MVDLDTKWQGFTKGLFGTELFMLKATGAGVVFVNTYGKANVDMSDGEIARKISELYDLRPAAIEQGLKLRNPIYLETASYGHMGRTPRKITKSFESQYWEPRTLEVELFTWEKLDYVDKFKEAFNVS